MRYLIVIACLVGLLMAGCRAKPRDTRLIEISEKVSSNPEEMLSILDSIDVGSLKEADRYFHAFLTIKAKDKAYVKHTSDSVIIRVIDYYSRHKRSGLYPETLYYGGRVYSDIGDAPTALRYFQEALDILSESTDDELRVRCLSQKSRLLNSLRLYSEAAGCLTDAMIIQSQGSDSINIMRNLQLLGAIYLHSKNYNAADSCFRLARNIGHDISHKDTLIHDMYLAGSALYRGDGKSALSQIRHVLSVGADNCRDVVYAYAAQIYIEEGVLDTAYLYAVRLINSHNEDYKKNGYGMLLGTELRKFSSTDSLLSYSLAYKSVLDNYLDRHDAQQVTTQTSLYNYQTHERERKIAEGFKRIYMYVAVASLILVMALCVVILSLRNKKMKLRLDYHKALDNIDRLENSLSWTEEELTKYKKEDDVTEKMELKSQSGTEISNKTNDDNSSEIIFKEEDKLREQLKERLLTLQRAGKATKNKPEKILNSLVYERLLKCIKTEKWLDEEDEIWSDIENDVFRLSPEFKSRLTLLVGGKIKRDVYHMALLVRCGFGPSATGVLLGRTKGAVSSRRSYICEKIFGEKLGAKVMDDILNLL